MNIVYSNLLLVYAKAAKNNFMKNSCARNYDAADKISLFLRKNVCFANVLENMKKEIAFAYLFSMDFRNLIFLIKGMKIITSIKSMGPWI